MKDAYQSCCLCGRDIEWLEETIGDNILAGIPIRHRACAERNAYLLSPPDTHGTQTFQFEPGHAIPCLGCSKNMTTGQKLLWRHGKGQGMPYAHHGCIREDCQ